MTKLKNVDSTKLILLVKLWASGLESIKKSSTLESSTLAISTLYLEGEGRDHTCALRSERCTLQSRTFQLYRFEPRNRFSPVIGLSVAISGQFGSQGALPLCYLSEYYVWIFKDTRLVVPVQ